MLAFLLVALLAGLHFGYQIQLPGLWNDEGFSYLLARLPLGDSLNASREYYFAPPLWYWIEKFTMALGLDPWGLRLPSLVATMVSACLLIKFSAFFTPNRLSRVLAPLFFLVSPMALYYAQEARSYALLGTLYLLAAIAAENLIKHSTRRWSLAYWLAMVLGFALHNYSVILWVSLNLYFLCGLWENSEQKQLRPWVYLQAATLVAVLPWLPRLWQSTTTLDHLTVLRQVWEGQHWWSAFGNAFRNLTPGDRGFSLVAVGRVKGWGMLATMAIGVSIFCNPYLSKPKTVARLLLLPTLPILLIALFSDFSKPAFLNGRTEAMVLPVFCGVAWVLATNIRYRVLQHMTVAIIAILGALACFEAHGRNSRVEKMRHFDRQLAEDLVNSDCTPIIIDGQVSAGLLAHLLDLAPQRQVQLFPAGGKGQPLEEQFLRQQSTALFADQIAPDAAAGLLHELGEQKIHCLAIISGRTPTGSGKIKSGPAHLAMDALRQDRHYKEIDSQEVRWDYLNKKHIVTRFNASP